MPDGNEEYIYAPGVQDSSGRVEGDVGFNPGKVVKWRPGVQDQTGRVEGDTGFNPETVAKYAPAILDGTGRVEGDVGFDPSTVPEYHYTPANDPNQSAPSGGGMTSPDLGGGGGVYTPGAAPAPVAAPLVPPTGRIDPIDFTNSPAWWGKGGKERAPNPWLDRVYDEKPPIMIDTLGNLNGMTGIASVSPLSSALRNGGSDGR